MSLVNPLDLEEVVRPKTLAEALLHLSRQDVVVYPLAGGTELLSGKASHVRSVLDLSDLQLRYITADSAYLHIGATTTLQDVVQNEHVREIAGGVLGQAAFASAPKVQRHQQTVGGTVAGGAGNCDLLVAALALDAQVVYYLPGDRDEPRVDPLAQFLAETRGHPPYLITELRVPLLRGDVQSRLERVSRTPRDGAIVNAAAVIGLEDGKIAHARVAVGGVAGHPIRLEAVEALLTGQAPADLDLAAVERTAREAVSPQGDWRGSAAYRRHLVGVLVRRTVQGA